MEMAMKLLEKNMPVQDIADVTGFTVEYVKSL